MRSAQSLTEYDHWTICWMSGEILYKCVTCVEQNQTVGLVTGITQTYFKKKGFLGPYERVVNCFIVGYWDITCFLILWCSNS